MELNEQEKALVLDLINIAWQAGAVKSPQVAALVEQLRSRLSQKSVASDANGRGASSELVERRTPVRELESV
jgi:hypothetical protein